MVLFLYSQTPTIISFYPKKGPMSGGTMMTIHGEHLDAGTTIQAKVVGLPCVIKRWLWKLYSNSDLIQGYGTYSPYHMTHFQYIGPWTRWTRICWHWFEMNLHGSWLSCFDLNLLGFVTAGSLDKSALVQAIVWCWANNKLISETIWFESQLQLIN